LLALAAAAPARAQQPAPAQASSPSSTTTRIHYREGAGISIEDGDTRMTMRFYVQPMIRYTKNSLLGDAQSDWIVRRARMDTEARLPNSLRLRFAVQAKNMHWGLNSIYGQWDPDSRTQVVFGYMKPPGGLERDSSSFDEPFIERSVVAFLTYDKEVGVRVRRDFANDKAQWAFAASKPATFGTDGGDPEDVPQTTNLPPGIEPEDLERGGGRVDFNGRVMVAPRHQFAAGIGGGLRMRDEGDLGDRMAEPYDAQIFGARFYHGNSAHVSGDVAASTTHVRVMAEAGYRHDGPTLEPNASGRLTATLGYVTVGVTPHGSYGRARDNAPLLKGWEIITRTEAARVVPPIGTGQASTWWSVTSGFHREVSPAFRLQFDVAFEHFDKHAESENTNGNRVIPQFWCTWRL
jgi:hypothetical protein